METIADGLHVFDYEELKLENQGYRDCIEERDKEISILCIRCDTGGQILAHCKEKVASCQLKANELMETLRTIELRKKLMRRTVNKSQAARDRYRSGYSTIEESDGLLMRDDLLSDMEESMEAIEEINVEIEKLRNRYGFQNRMLKGIREQLEMIAPLAGKERVLRKGYGCSVRRRSPSIISPTIPKCVLGYYPFYRGSSSCLSLAKINSH